MNQPRSQQYDGFADDYRKTRHTPVRRYVEAYTFLGLVGDVAGLRVLDLACGDGLYSRRLAQLGAAEVIGVDISAEMISLAQAEERNARLGIKYHVADAAALPDLGQFDLVTAAYLLHYASDTGELARMCDGIAAALRPGGRFVALNENPRQHAGDFPAYAQYGFSKRIDAPLADGARITYWMLNGASWFSFEASWFSASTYERMLDAAGIADVRWHAPCLDPAGAGAHADGYFDAYLADPPVLALEGRRR